MNYLSTPHWNYFFPQLDKDWLQVKEQLDHFWSMWKEKRDWLISIERKIFSWNRECTWWLWGCTFMAPWLAIKCQDAGGNAQRPATVTRGSATASDSQITWLLHRMNHVLKSYSPYHVLSVHWAPLPRLGVI